MDGTMRYGPLPIMYDTPDPVYVGSDLMPSDWDVIDPYGASSQNAYMGANPNAWQPPAPLTGAHQQTTIPDFTYTKPTGSVEPPPDPELAHNDIYLGDSNYAGPTYNYFNYPRQGEEQSSRRGAMFSATGTPMDYGMHAYIQSLNERQNSMLRQLMLAKTMRQKMIDSYIDRMILQGGFGG